MQFTYVATSPLWLALAAVAAPVGTKSTSSEFPLPGSRSRSEDTRSTGHDMTTGEVTSRTSAPQSSIADIYRARLENVVAHYNRQLDALPLIERYPRRMDGSHNYHSDHHPVIGSPGYAGPPQMPGHPPLRVVHHFEGSNASGRTGEHHPYHRANHPHPVSQRRTAVPSIEDVIDLRTGEAALRTLYPNGGSLNWPARQSLLPQEPQLGERWAESRGMVPPVITVDASHHRSAPAASSQSQAMHGTSSSRPRSGHKKENVEEKGSSSSSS